MPILNPFDHMSEDQFLALPEEEQDEVIADLWTYMREQGIVPVQNLIDVGQFINQIVKPN